MLPMWLIIRCFLVVLCSPFVALAAELGEVTVTRINEQYVISSRVKINTPREFAYQTATDFTQLPALSPSIINIDVITSDGERITLLTELENCIWFFCKRVTKLSKVVLTQNESIRFEVVPDKSDFSVANELFMFKQNGKGEYSYIDYSATLMPKFKIPRLIDLWLVRRQVANEIKVSATNIERLYRTEPSVTRGK